jgi:ribonuclease HI
MVGAEQNYTGIEKLCLALIFSLKKLRHYTLSHEVQLIARADPVKYVLSQPALLGRLGKWAVLMMEFDITYVPQKAVKGQALADFLAAHPVPDDSPLITDLPDEEVFTVSSKAWEMHFDGAARTEKDLDGAPRRRAGAGLVFKSPMGQTFYHSYSLLKEGCSNNEAEYEALIFGLLLALSMNIHTLHAFGDSQLIVRQVNGVYEVHKPELAPYCQAAQKLMRKFENIQVDHIPRGENSSADALAKLASSLVFPGDDHVQIRVEERWLLPAVLELVQDEYEVNIIVVANVEESDWRKPFLDYFNHGSLPDDHATRRQLLRRAPSYWLKADVLYKRSFDGVLLRCVSRSEANMVLNEVHSGVCGGHQSGAKMYHSVRLAGYYWPGIMKDCLDVAKACHMCQIHGDFKHRPPAPLHPTVPSWPFDAWGIDVMGPFDPPSAGGHRFILAATDYFSRWAEAVPLP